MKYIMLQGTSSNVGKSILVTALCRIFHQEAMKVVPFKAQNMALNSYVTKDGKEMGRAQVAQAEAAGLEPFVEMNPVLLKPTGNATSQVILMGKAIGNMSAKEYHKGYSLKAFDTVKLALDKLQKDYEVMVIEGAGSPAEVNLKANDIVNMRIAKHLKAPVLLVADIDRGGALASLVGTLELLDEEERDLVKGLIINKFRGDVTILQPALDFLEEKTGKPVLGVVPYLEKLNIDDEDSVQLENKPQMAMEKKDADLKIMVIRTPKISNFTDFAALSHEEDVQIKYILAEDKEDLLEADLIILPGSKNTTEDMAYITKTGIKDVLLSAHKIGIPIIGICGGYQMLGTKIKDPHKTESSLLEIDGLALLNMETTFHKEKLTSQVLAKTKNFTFCGEDFGDCEIYGYEIHMGKTEFKESTHPLIITHRQNEGVLVAEGLINNAGNVFGSYIHGIFDADIFRRKILNALRKRKNIKPLKPKINYASEKEKAYNRLAETVRNSLDMKKVHAILKGEI